MKIANLLTGLLAFLPVTGICQQNIASETLWFFTDKAPVGGGFGISIDKAIEFVKEKKKEPVIVAVIDNGTDISHEALKNYLWINTKEIPGNEQDDDKNGYIDDIYGWNFIGGKQGGSLSDDTYEYSRVYFKYKPFFSTLTSTAAEKLPGDSLLLYQTWKKAEKIQENVITDISKQVSRFGQIISSDSILRKHFKTIFSSSDLTGFTPKDTLLLHAKQILSESFTYWGNAHKTNRDLTEMAKRAYDTKFKQLLTAQKKPVDYRGQVVNDDYNNINDCYYGNSNVTMTSPYKLHGTHVAGIIARICSELCPVKLMIIRAVPSGDEHDKDVAMAIRYAVDNGAKIINMSFGKALSPEKKWVDEAVRYAESKNVLLVHAAGNEALDIDSIDRFPTPYYDNNPQLKAANWINVGASDLSGEKIIASFSNYGKKNVDVFAPGTYIYSSIPSEEKYTYMDGTSMAAPVVSSLAALLISCYPNLTAIQLKNVIEQSVIKPKELVIKPGPKEQELVSLNDLCKSGGIINYYTAVKLAQEVNEAGLTNKLTDTTGYSELMGIINRYLRSTGSLKRKAAMAQSLAQRDSLLQQLNILLTEKQNTLLKFKSNHSSSVLIPELIRFSGSFDYTAKRNAFTNLSDDQKESEYGINLKKELDRESEKIGKPAPGFSLPATTGSKVTLSQLTAGAELILIDFWASWCHPCREEFPALKKLYEKFHQQGLNIVGISIDNNTPAWKEAIKKDGTPWIHLIDVNKKVYDLYNGIGVPRQVLVNKKGEIIEWDLHLDYNQLEKKIDQLLNNN